MLFHGKKNIVITGVLYRVPLTLYMMRFLLWRGDPMKYTIEGFSQEYAMTLKKNVPIKDGKEKTIQIDCTDLVILRWFVDFYPNMKKISVDGREYAWLTHKKLLDDLPLLDITKRACIERMQKLVEFGILDYKLLKDGGTFSLYTFGMNYINLIRSTDTGGVQSNNIGGIRSTDTGGCGQTDNKDNSIIYPSISDKSIKDNKKERKNGYEEILSRVENDGLKELYLEYIKMRKLIKSPMTDRALTMLIKKVEDLEPYSIDRQKRLLETAIMNNWKSVYPLKDNEPKQTGQKRNANSNVFLAMLEKEMM